MIGKYKRIVLLPSDKNLEPGIDFCGTVIDKNEENFIVQYVSSGIGRKTPYKYDINACVNFTQCNSSIKLNKIIDWIKNKGSYRQPLKSFQ